MSRVLRYNLCKYHFFRSYKILRSYCAHILPGGKRNDFMSAETRCAHACVLSIAWKVAAVVWALVIFYLSTGPFGPTFTGPLLAGALSLVHLTVSPPSFEVLHLCVRKAAHLIEYAIFAYLLGESSEEEVAAGEFIPSGSGPRPISPDSNAQWRHQAASTPSRKSRPWRQRRLLACFLILVAYSLTDEYHQSFVPGRSASLTDCGIDSLGGAVGMLVYYVNNLRLRAVGLCGTGILPVSNHGQDGQATIPSGGERPPRQKVQSDPTVKICGTGILPVSNHGQDGPATIPSGGERPPRQKVQSDPTVKICGTGILPASNHGQDGPATMHSGGERPPRQKVQSDPIPSLRRHEISGQNTRSYFKTLRKTIMKQAI